VEALGFSPANKVPAGNRALAPVESTAPIGLASYAYLPFKLTAHSLTTHL